MRNIREEIHRHTADRARGHGHRSTRLSAQDGGQRHHEQWADRSIDRRRIRRRAKSNRLAREACEAQDMKDLLGNATEEIPSMTAPLPWRVFYVNEYEYWVAHTMDELKDLYLREVHSEETFEDAYELTDIQLAELKILEDDPDGENPTGKTICGTEYLYQIRDSLTRPEYFCGSE
jgi:hypothetical protein